MTVVILPGQFRADPHPAGKLASTLLSVTLAGMADPPRFRRGKQYVLDRAVTRIELSCGTLRGWVQGSRPEAYEVIATTTLVERPPAGNAESLRPHLSRLTPEAGDLMLSCTCPDWDDPCKHAVAALLAFADELTARPELLLEFRCASADDDARPRVGARARGHLRLAPPLPADEPAPTAPSPFTAPEWVEFFGERPFPEPPDVDDEAAPVGQAALGTIDVGRWLRSALDELRWFG
jgi:hypothetical protein